jgi:hypothetical protein
VESSLQICIRTAGKKRPASEQEERRADADSMEVMHKIPRVEDVDEVDKEFAAR